MGAHTVISSFSFIGMCSGVVSIVAVSICWGLRLSSKLSAFHSVRNQEWRMMLGRSPREAECLPQGQTAARRCQSSRVFVGNKTVFCVNCIGHVPLLVLSLEILQIAFAAVWNWEGLENGLLLVGILHRLFKKSALLKRLLEACEILTVSSLYIDGARC